MSKQKSGLIILFLIVCMSSTNIVARAELVGHAYLVVKTSDAYHMLRLDLANDGLENLFDVQIGGEITLAEIIPDDELTAVTSYSQLHSMSLDSMLNSQVDASVRAIRVSVDNEIIAMEVRYQTCFNPQDAVCFGTTQLAIVSPPEELVTVFNIGLHSSEYFPNVYLNFVPDVEIDKIMWTPDQQVLIVSLSDEATRRNSANRSIIVIPWVVQAVPFRIGEAQAWQIAPNSHQIAAIERNPTDLTDILTVIDFDLTLREVSQSSNSLGTLVTAPNFGVAYLQEAIGFIVGYDTALLEGGSGVGIFDNIQPEPLSIFSAFSLGIRSYGPLQNSPNGVITLMQDADGILWRLLRENETLSAQPFLNIPVASWSFGQSNSVLVQATNSSILMIVEADGTVVREFDILPDIEALYSDAELTIIDW